MNDIAIKVENLSKLYKIGARQQGYKTLRESIMGTLAAPFQRLKRLSQSTSSGQQSTVNGQRSDDTIWALKDVSFEVKRGEVVGIIGRNGAGKTTLLKILSRITEPTEGRAEIHGRVRSLLEVGTGFHPELTGRENIYLNGAILGMGKGETDRKFDEIVAFAEIDKFIDTPVKRYSSGMYVRLAFAVAAHLEPEILLVDEVLAVGDAAFQKKCLGKMGEIAGEGRTVLFVSHNMGAVERLCDRAIWLSMGRVEHDGASCDVIQRYIVNSDYEHITGYWQAEQPDLDSSPVSLLMAYIANESIEKACSVVAYNESFMLVANYLVLERIRTWSLIFRVIDSVGNVIFATSDTDGQFHAERWQEPGTYRANCTVPRRLLRPGVYNVTITTHIHGLRIIEMHENAFCFEVSDVGHSVSVNRRGIITPMLDWTTETLQQ